MICYHARWVLPITAAPIEQGTVACDEGVIRYVGPRTGAPAGESYDLGDALLMPGLVNTHTHLELTAMRGLLEGLSFPAWIDTLRQARNTILTDDTLLDSARLGVLEGIEHGVTTYADTCSSGVVLRALRELSVRGIMYQEVFGPDPSVCDAALADLVRRIDTLRPDQTEFVRLGVSPHAPYTVSDALYRATAAYAREAGLPMAMHIAESVEEHQLVEHGAGEFAERLKRRNIPVAPRARSPIALLDELGCLADKPLLIHAVRTDENDIRTIVRSDCSIAHCPASNAKLGHGIAPLTDFLAAGIRVGLGSDSVASNNRMDMLEEGRLASLFQNARAHSPTALSAEGALELATLGGARALGLDGVIGSLDVGKSADLAAFPLRTSRTAPAQHPVATAIYAISGALASLVTVAGHHLLEDGQHTVHPGTLRDRVASVGRALAASGASV
jgi:5-methylthioadenosine/S-adenosylhomocysteine deaminase